MENHSTRTSPRTLARIGGALYLVIIFFGVFGEMFVRNRLVVWGDPTATAESILASESLWRFGIATQLFYLLCAVALAAIFFVLLRPVNRDLALLAVFFNLVAIAVEATSRLHLFSALTILRGAERLAAFTTDQQHALAYLSLQHHGRGFSASLLFFGCVCLVVGYLMFHSGYLPRFLGVLLLIAGLGYLTDGFALILSPAFHTAIFPASLLPAFVAESAVCLWFLIRGVNLDKWNERTSAQSTLRI